MVMGDSTASGQSSSSSTLTFPFLHLMSNIYRKVRKEPRSWREEASEAPRLRSALSRPLCCSFSVMWQSRGPQHYLCYYTLCQTLFIYCTPVNIQDIFRMHLCASISSQCPIAVVLNLMSATEVQERKNNVGESSSGWLSCLCTHGLLIKTPIHDFVISHLVLESCIYD